MKTRLRFLLALFFSLLPFQEPALSHQEKDEVTVPFTMEANHIVISVTVNDKPGKAMVDTGYEADVLLPTEAKKYGVNAKDGKATVKVADFAVSDMAWMVMDAPAIKNVQRDTGVGMLLGAPFLNHYTVTFNFKKNQITFRKPEAKAPAFPKNAVTLPFENFRGCLVLETKVNGKGPFRALLDTGSPYIRATTDVFSKSGLQGEMAAAQTLQVGTVTLKNMQISSNSQLTAMLKRAGLDMLLGLRFLSRYTATIDYKNKKLILVE